MKRVNKFILLVFASIFVTFHQPENVNMSMIYCCLNCMESLSRVYKLKQDKVVQHIPNMVFTPLPNRLTILLYLLSAIHRISLISGNS